MLCRFSPRRAMHSLFFRYIDDLSILDHIACRLGLSAGLSFQSCFSPESNSGEIMLIINTCEIYRLGLVESLSQTSFLNWATERMVVERSFWASLKSRSPVMK